jgi:Rieske Fe-S protein
VKRLQIIREAACRSLGRREVLGGTIASIALACSGGADAPQPFGEVSAGNAEALSVGSIRIIPGAPACIARDARGIYAMTLTCTHEGCDIATEGTVSASSIVCGCHGSEFDANGDVVRGPATSPLDHFAVTTDTSGNLTVNGGTVVPASERLAF